MWWSPWLIPQGREYGHLKGQTIKGKPGTLGNTLPGIMLNAKDTLGKDTVWKNDKFTLTQKVFREMNSSVNCSIKNTAFTNFFNKCEGELP